MCIYKILKQVIDFFDFFCRMNHSKVFNEYFKFVSIFDDIVFTKTI